MTSTVQENKHPKLQFNNINIQIKSLLLVGYQLKENMVALALNKFNHM